MPQATGNNLLEEESEKLVWLFCKIKMRHPGIEPGASAWEAPMLPLHQWRSQMQSLRAAAKGGESGFRSRCLVVANDALYRLS